MKERLEELEGSFRGDPISDLKILTEIFPGKVVFSTSFGMEDQAVTHIIARNNIPVDIFTLDTGRLFEETLEVYQKTEARYKTKIKSYHPDASELSKYYEDYGVNGFYKSIENRKLCCAIRKVHPLKKALQGNAIWVTGLRAEQSDNRSDMPQLEWDEGNQIIKYHPVLDWDENKLENFIKENDIPVNTLHKKGYPSIGCAPCTRAITEGEHPRAGRWSWETSKKECGLHSIK